MGLLNNIHKFPFRRNDDDPEDLFKNGLDLGRTLLAGEDAQDFQALHVAFVREFHPVDEGEARHVSDLTHHKWVADRANLLQMQILSSLQPGENPGPAFNAYLRYQTVNERSYERSLSQFLAARAAAAKALEAGRKRRDPNEICLMWIGQNGNWECMPGFESRFSLRKWRRTHGNDPVNIPEGYVRHEDDPIE